MDFYTFLDSAVALGPYFQACVALGHSGAYTDESLLLEIKPLGIKAESDMYMATGGVNTHKGLIYALGLLSAASGSCLTREADIPSLCIESICRKVQSMVEPHMGAELEVLKTTSTYGARQYQNYGLLGARGEALSGYEKAREVGLNALEKGLDVYGLSMNEAMLYVLLSLIVVVDDSNVIGRRGTDILRQSQIRAQDILDAGHFISEEGRQLYTDYLQWSMKEGVSHGGAADMLSVSVFLWLLKKGR
jgi:triphosphoribosyl-dephospho-CoA synthase